MVQGNQQVKFENKYAHKVQRQLQHRQQTTDGRMTDDGQCPIPTSADIVKQSQKLKSHP